MVLLTTEGEVGQQSIRGNRSLVSTQRACRTILLDANGHANGAHGVTAHADDFRDDAGRVEGIMANGAFLRNASITAAVFTAYAESC